MDPEEINKNTDRTELQMLYEAVIKMKIENSAIVLNTRDASSDIGSLKVINIYYLSNIPILYKLRLLKLILKLIF